MFAERLRVATIRLSVPRVRYEGGGDADGYAVWQWGKLQNTTSVGIASSSDPGPSRHSAICRDANH